MRVWCFLLLASTCCAEADLKALYETRQWFKLREAIAGASAPALYRGAVALAFNRTEEAEKELREVIRSAPDSDDAGEAHGLLMYFYMRSGQSRHALSLFDDADPNLPSAKAARAWFGALSQYPEQSVARRRPSKVRYAMKEGHLFLPLAISGQPAHYLLDTGANYSMLSESEAARLGLTLRAASTTLDEATGAGLEVSHIAVADKLTIGKVELRNVVFLVAPDGIGMFSRLAAGERGMLGLPVALALESLRWGLDGTLEIGSPSTRVAKPNLCLDSLALLAEGRFGEGRVQFHLDTGAPQTILYPKFHKEFTGVVGERDSWRINGLNSSSGFAAIRAPELRFMLGSFETVLRPAYVISQEIRAREHGILGMDLLNQGRAVRLDFKSMTLTMEGSPLDAELALLFQTHQWFKLREAVQANGSPAFYKDAVACAFNDGKRCRKRLAQIQRKKSGYSSIRYTKPGGQVVVPLTIDGHAANYSISTDGPSMIGESEARRLGVQTAHRLKIGNIELRSVTFQIVPDKQAPLGGVIGVPVLIALQSVRWKADGIFETGFPSQRAEPNLCIDGEALATKDGRLGMDTLNRASAVTLDFRSMRLTLE